jgi:glutaredoxin
MRKIGLIDVVMVITQDGCEYCSKLKRFLSDRNIGYVEQDFKDLSKSISKELVRCRKENNIKKVGLPLWIYKDTLYEGYDEVFLNELFGG